MVSLAARRPYSGRTRVGKTASVEKEVWDQVPAPWPSGERDHVEESERADSSYGSPPNERIVEEAGLYHSAPLRTLSWGLGKLLIMRLDVDQEAERSIERVPFTGEGLVEVKGRRKGTDGV